MSDFARELHSLMKQRGMSNAELARRLGVKRQFVTKLLGGANVTLATMVKLAMALDAVVRVRLEDREDRSSLEDADSGVIFDLAVSGRERGRGVASPQEEDVTREAICQPLQPARSSGGRK
jgi:transcriptional regulator with XRE-family HTH domain